MESFLLTFIPLFAAIDPPGMLPLFLGLTREYSKNEKRKLAVQSVTTAFLVGLIFGVAGPLIFRFLGITTADFRIGGGLLLLILSVLEIFGSTARMTEGAAADNFMGVVPLGIPLIAGPAVITTILILRDEWSLFLIMGALAANLLITLVLFLNSDRILSWIGVAASKAVGKLVAIFLAAIAVMMIRKGIVAAFLIKN